MTEFSFFFFNKRRKIHNHKNSLTQINLLSAIPALSTQKKKKKKKKKKRRRRRRRRRTEKRSKTQNYELLIDFQK
jgi:hypothetical protein